MPDARTITCTNTQDNLSITLRKTSAAPWFLTSFSGMYDTDFDVFTSENANIDGSIYQSSRIGQRNIVLTIKNRSKHSDGRHLLARIFAKGQCGTLQYSNGVVSRKIDYYTEKADFSDQGVRSDDSGIVTATISLICPDPYFYDLYDTSFTMSSFMPSFSFKHAFMVAKEEFGYRQKEKIKVINNDLSVDGTGMTIKISCNGSVKNPSITRVEDHAHIYIGTTAKPLNLVAGDVVTVTTESGNKKVTLTHDGNTSSINQYLSEDSSFLQLRRGTNSIGYSADEGVDSMIIGISYRQRYTSV